MYQCRNLFSPSILGLSGKVPNILIKVALKHWSVDDILMSIFSLPVQFHTMPLTDHSPNYALDLLRFSLEAHNVIYPINSTLYT